MKRIHFLTAVLMAGVSVFALAGPAEATYGDTRPCATNPEYNAIKRNLPMARVHSITDGQGTKVSTWVNGQQRDYRRCDGGTVSVRYLRGASGVWRVVGKSATQPLTIERWIDGDTVKVREWKSAIRVIGIDAPATSARCGPGATANAKAIAPIGSKITITVRLGTDGSNRHLASFSNDQGYDFGARMIMRGQADARYVARNGHPQHPKQNLYRSLDQRFSNICTIIKPPAPKPPAPKPPTPKPPAPTVDRWNRPVSSSNPDLDCIDIQRRVRVLPPDYHGLDRDGDGYGCDSYG